MEHIQIYDKKSNNRLSDNFSLAEFACRGKNCCHQVLVDQRLVEYLQQIRDHFAKPVTVNSGYRCPVHNRRIGGAAGSFHTKGMAADISVADTPPAQVAAYAQQLGIGGIGLYETDADGYFVHIDTRESKAFWYGQAQIPRQTFLSGGYREFVTRLQQSLDVTVDGIAGKETLAAAPTISADHNSRHGVIAPVQDWLFHLGYREVGVADGIAGPRFTRALQRFQQEHGCAPTGIAEQWGKTWHCLLQMQQEVIP